VPDGKRDIDTLKTLLDSACELVAGLAHGSTKRALSALAAIPPDERSVIATVLERAAVAWQQSEAFTPLHHIRLRANPNAQLFVRVLDDVKDPAPEELDLMPEAVRLMRRLGVSMLPELRAVWEPALLAAVGMVTANERADCVQFLERALAIIASAPEREEAPDDGATAQQGARAVAGAKARERRGTED